MAVVGDITSTASIAVDAAGNLYAANEDHAGDGGGVVVYGPDGTKRVLATDTKARALAVDGAGNVYFTSARATLGVISPIFGVTILAGRTDDPGDEDGVGQAARFRSPGALALDPAGNVYVADGTKIRRVTPQGAVTTIADISNVQGAQPGFALRPSSGCHQGTCLAGRGALRNRCQRGGQDHFLNRLTAAIRTLKPPAEYGCLRPQADAAPVQHSFMYRRSHCLHVPSPVAMHATHLESTRRLCAPFHQQAPSFLQE